MEGIIRYDEINKEYYINEKLSPNVFSYAKKYFNCSNLTKIFLEKDEENNIHWPQKLFLGELMSNYNYSEEQILSNFTLNFLSDLPFLKLRLNYSMGNLYKFGKNKGCDFITNSYNNNINNILKNYPKCSSGRLGKSLTEINQDYIYTGHCNENFSENKNITLKNIFKESFSSISFCVLSSLINKEYNINYNISEFDALCYEMFCSDLSLTIKIGDRYIVCPRSGGKIKVKDFEGYLLCPDYNLICSSTILCNNLINCIEKKSQEKSSDILLYDYEIKTTQNPDIYINDTLNYDGYELTNKGICPFLCAQCDINKYCIKCKPHYEFKNNKCSEVIEKCIKYKDNESDICLQCDKGYFVAFFNEKYFCEKNSNKNFYYAFNNVFEGFIYYKKCDLDLNNCEQCLSEKKCIKCKKGFYLVKNDVNNKIECLNIDLNYYYEINDGEIIYYNKCENNFAVVENDNTKCEDLSTNKYYFNMSENKYKLCSNKFNQCEKCLIKNENNSNLMCIKCFDDFSLIHKDWDNIFCDKKYFLKIIMNFILKIQE